MSKSTKAYMVINKDDDIYAASNGSTKGHAFERHRSDTGEPWEKRFAKGDRLVEVKIKIVKKFKV